MEQWGGVIAFYQAATQKSMTLAGVAMGGKTQSAISQAVAKLEADLGVVLLNRGGRNDVSQLEPRRTLTLTREGQIVYKAVEKMLLEWQRAIEKIQQLKDTAKHENTVEIV